MAANLADSGVTNPVTAVLLNFRAYDTLLELAVLLAAVLGIFALGPARPGYRAGRPGARRPDPLAGAPAHRHRRLPALGRARMPRAAPFRPGALLAAAAVLLRLGGHAGAGLPGPVLQRWLLAGGVGVFLTGGLAVTVAGLAFLEYPRAWSGCAHPADRERRHPGHRRHAGPGLYRRTPAGLGRRHSSPRTSNDRSPADARSPKSSTASPVSACSRWACAVPCCTVRCWGGCLSINVCGAGVFLVFVTLAYRGSELPPDPVPHALVLTGIVVAVSATALALALGRRLREAEDE